MRFQLPTIRKFPETIVLFFTIGTGALTNACIDVACTSTRVMFRHCSVYEPYFV